MGIYAIHAPEPIDGFRRLEDVRAVKSGFSLAALIFGPLWLLARGLCIAFVAYGAAAAVVIALAGFGALSPGAAFALFALGALYLGFEGPALRAVALERGGRPVADVLLEDGAARAERAFIAGAIARSAAASRAAGPSRREPEIIGLFPQRGR